MKLTPKLIEISKRYPTPSLLFSLSRIKKNYREIKDSIKDVEVFYAVKANDHPKILQTLIQEESSFEISSLNELKSLLKFKVPPSKIACLNPIKSPELLVEMNKNEIEVMAFDSFEEVDKIAKYAPRSKVVLRISVNNEGSDWPLTRKFGVDAAEAVPFMKYAERHKVQPIGITFHVGSQCLNKNNWSSALYVCDDIWKQAKIAGLELSCLSLGGGIPIKHTKKIPSISEIGKIVNKILSNNFNNEKTKLKVTIEPGRGLVGDAAVMVASVVGKAQRGIEEWIYIDVGVFNGLMETIQNFTYELKTEKNRKRKTITLAGPSCDSVDIMYENVELPSVKVGDKVFILNTGAYTSVYASDFNGFDPPKTYFID